MYNNWQLQDAKNKLSQVINNAIIQGPQIITKHGKKTAVIIAYEDYLKTNKKKNKISEFFQSSPMAGISMDLRREKEYPVDIEL